MSPPAAVPDDDGAPSPVDALVRRYVEAREEGRDPRLAELRAEAGPHRAQLDRDVEVYEAFRDLGQRAREEDDGVPERLGPFELAGRIARGGGGFVYRARDTRLDRMVALKLLAVGFLSRDERALILHEARSMARLEHEGICRVLEVGEAEGRDYVAMELLEGPTLWQVVQRLAARRAGAPDADEAPPGLRELADRLESTRERVRVLVAITRALHFAHDRGVLHRDVKPQNILFTADGQPKLIDFGNAHHGDPDSEAEKLDLTSQLVGTAGFLAPEQIESGSIGRDPRSDQFALGVVAYHLLSLTLPFDGETRTARLEAVASGELAPLRSLDPSLSVELERVVHHALERAPADRYPSLKALADDLEAILADRPISVEAPTLGRLLRLWLRRNRRRVTLAAVVGVLLLVALVAPWVVRARSAVADILDRVAAAGEVQAETTDDLLSAGQKLQVLRRDAQSHDASLLRRWMTGSVSTDVSAACDDWSRRIAEAFRRATAEGAGTLQARAWMRLIDLEQLVAPESRHNLALRARGHVRFPDVLEAYETRLVRQETLAPTGFLGGFRTYRPVDAFGPPRPGLVPLSPGIYRLLAWRPGARRLAVEREFSVPDAWGPVIELTLVLPLDELRDAAVSVPGTVTTRTAPPVAGVPELVRLRRRIPAFRLTQLVTREEFVSRMGPERSAAKKEGVERCSAEEAQTFAALVGGRLPSAPELLHAHALGLIDFPREAATGEWTGEGNRTERDTAYLLHYRLLDEREPEDWYFRFLESHSRRVTVVDDPEGGSIGSGFRVLFPDDEPQAYQHFDDRGETDL